MAPDTTDGCIPSKMGAEEMEVVDIPNNMYMYYCIAIMSVKM